MGRAEEGSPIISQEPHNKGGRGTIYSKLYSPSPHIYSNTRYEVELRKRVSCDTKGDIFEENVHGDKRLYRRLNDITELGDFVLKSIHCNDRELEVLNSESGIIQYILS